MSLQDDNGTPVSSEEMEAARRALTGLADLLEGKSNRCPICKAIVTSREQVGRCVYLNPCGHHYVGKLSQQKVK